MLPANTRQLGLPLLLLTVICSSDLTVAQTYLTTTPFRTRSGYNTERAVVNFTQGDLKTFGRGGSLEYYPHLIDLLTGELQDLTSGNARPITSDLIAWNVMCHKDHFELLSDIVNQDSISRDVGRYRYEYDGTFIDSTRWTVELPQKVATEDQTSPSIHSDDNYVYFMPNPLNYNSTNNRYVYILNDTSIVSRHYVNFRPIAFHAARLFKNRYVILDEGIAVYSRRITPGEDQLDSVGQFFQPFQYSKPGFEWSSMNRAKRTHYTLDEYNDRLYAYGVSGRKFVFNVPGVPHMLTSGIMAVVVDSTMSVVDTATFFTEYDLDRDYNWPTGGRLNAADGHGRFYASTIARRLNEREYRYYLVCHDENLDILWEINIPIDEYGPRDIIPIGKDRVWMVASQLYWDDNGEAVGDEFSFILGPEGIISSAHVAQEVLPEAGRAVPNPVREAFRVDGLSAEVAATVAEVNLYDAGGRLAAVRKIGPEASVEVADLPPGQYIAVARDVRGAAVATFPVVKQ